MYQLSITLIKYGYVNFVFFYPFSRSLAIDALIKKMLTLMERGFWMLLEGGRFLIQPAFSRSLRITLKNHFFDYLKFHNELGKVTKGTSRPLLSWRNSRLKILYHIILFCSGAFFIVVQFMQVSMNDLVKSKP